MGRGLWARPATQPTAVSACARRLWTAPNCRKASSLSLTDTVEAARAQGLGDPRAAASAEWAAGRVACSASRERKVVSKGTGEKGHPFAGWPGARPHSSAPNRGSWGTLTPIERRGRRRGVEPRLGLGSPLLCDQNGLSFGAEMGSYVPEAGSAHGAVPSGAGQAALFPLCSAASRASPAAEARPGGGGCTMPRLPARPPSSAAAFGALPLSCPSPPSSLYPLIPPFSF